MKATPAPPTTLRRRCAVMLGLGCGWLACGSDAAPLHVPAHCHRVQRMTQTAREDQHGLGLVLFSVQESGRRILLRVGYINAGDKPWSRAIDAPLGDVLLESSLQGKKLKAVHVDSQLRRPDFSAGLTPRECRAGSVQFELEEGDDGNWLRAPLTLTFNPFMPLSFDLSEAEAITPPEMSRLSSNWDMGATMRPAVEALAYFPLRVGKTAVVENRIVFEVGFRNASRFALKWSGTLGGKQARLLTEEAELLRPLNVSPGIAERIAPKGVWKPQQENAGTIAFDLPHPLGAGRLSLLLPGYEPLTLVYDQQTLHWAAAPRAVPADALPSKVDQIRIEQGIFDELVDFWQEMTSRLAARRFDEFLGRFSAGELRDQQRQFVAGAEKLPVSQIQFSLPPFQTLSRSPDGVRGLWVDLRWLVAGLPRDNEFVTRMACDLRRVSGGGWEVTRIAQVARPPFWTLGLTQMYSSEHFVLFAEPGEDRAKKGELALNQLEKAWARLKRTRLPLGQRYLAFAVDDKDSFKQLTARDPETFSGATSAAFAERDGELRVINQAIYINDFRLFSMQRLWSKQDRQVTIQHELTHLALAPLTRPWTPSWLIEGMAMRYAGQVDSFGREALAKQMPRDLHLARLSSVPYLGYRNTDATRLSLEYQYSGEVVKWLESKLGEEGLISLYGAFARFEPDDWQTPLEPLFNVELDSLGERREAITRQVLEKSLQGMTLEQLDEAVRAEIAR